MKSFKGHITEGRPSQRHPLEGHEYHKKSDEALIHIAKDAHAAAEAMKGHNEKAENKYRDQANDSATVRYYRQKHGMADWYKKKYGHVKEETISEREDDEYHTPSKHYVRVQVSKGDGPKTHFKATVRAKEPQHAVSAAIAHYKQKGYTVHNHEYLHEDWQKVNKADRTDGLSQKAVDAYRREHPGSKLKTAVTEKNPTGKRAARRKSFCSRMGGMKKRLTNPENARDPDSPINKALRRWNC